MVLDSSLSLSLLGKSEGGGRGQRRAYKPSLGTWDPLATAECLASMQILRFLYVASTLIRVPHTVIWYSLDIWSTSYPTLSWPRSTSQCVHSGLSIIISGFLPPQPKPGPYFTARYAEAIRIKWLAQSHDSKVWVGIELTALVWEPKTHDNHWTSCSHTHTHTHTYTHTHTHLSLIHIWRCRRIERCRSRWSPYH